ncbi:RHS repeat-associated core domain-containing protein [Sulfurovum mangrovi]|uniref:RHS repeat-associated core domain-containing protein n=1 Tax=Sulfurovum mangrovi TaxID=2893889 RepID=UPI001E3A051C|nr:RHS repeat-associated core domain-containing protein [Sulfurovum mangrovi]UFH58581.1 hypothetical protein LN246_09485 [Sulfurovum mangrovi]
MKPYKIILFFILLCSIQVNATIVGTTKGEFSVDRGTANYELKIDVPPGIAGMEPKLSLNYSSSSGNGYMGVGWSIGGLSAITRCAQTKAVDGPNRKFGVKYNSDDRFCLDGQRLINISGVYGASGTEYRTEIDTYSKVTSYDDLNGGPSYFEVKTKSGLTYIYGRDNGASMLTEENGVARFWKVSKIIDTYDNEINFHYIQDKREGIHYIDHISYADNQIEFVYEDRPDVSKGYHGGFISQVNQRLKNVIVTTQNGANEVRRYKVAYTNEVQEPKRSMITSLTESVDDENLKKLDFTWQSGRHKNGGMTLWSNNASDIKQYNPTHNHEGNTHSQFIDINGDGLPDRVHHYNYMTRQYGLWVQLNSGHDFGEMTLWSDNATKNEQYRPSWGGGEYSQFIDINGDGLPDRVHHYNYLTRQYGLWVQLNSGHDFGEMTLWSDNATKNEQYRPSWGGGAYSQFIDINGDGLPDRVHHYNYLTRQYGLWVQFNSGHDFGEMTLWSDNTGKVEQYRPSWGAGEYSQFIDINGDGLPDRVHHKNYIHTSVGSLEIPGLWIQLNSGHDFGKMTRWSYNTTKNEQCHPSWGGGEYSQFIDINGDGLPDRVHHYNYMTRQYGLWVQLNSGHDFGEMTLWSDNATKNEQYRPSWGGGEYSQFIDINGDGLPDRVHHYNYLTRQYGLWVQLNSGHDFGEMTLWSDNATRNSQYRPSWDGQYSQFIDINGDGLPDRVHHYNYMTKQHGLWVQLNTVSRSLITKITNNTDQNIEISYKNMTDSKIYHNYSVYGQRNAFAWNDLANDNIEVTSAKPLVYRVESANGIGGTNSIRYKYYGYIINKLRGSQGFHAIDTIDETTQRYTTTYYKQIKAPNGEGFQYTGMPFVSYTGQDDTTGTMLSKTVITYADRTDLQGIDGMQAKVHQPYTRLNLQTVYAPGTTTEIKKVYHYNTLSEDGLGNIVSTLDRTVDLINNKSFTKTTTNEYTDEDESSWIIGRLTKSTVVHEQTDGNRVVKSSSFEYNDHGILSKEVANAGTDVALTKEYTYDSFGNKASETVSGLGIVTATTTFGYSDDGKFQTTITNAAELTETRTYDPRFGTLKTLTGPNILTTRWEYDGLGRKTAEYRADGTQTTWKHSWDDGSLIGANHALYSVKVESSGQPESVTYYDMLGREVGSYSYILDKRVQKLKTYNSRGELIEETLPHFSGNIEGKIITTYDDYGRAVEVSKPGPENTRQTYTTTHENFTQIVTDPKGNKKKTVKNAIDQTVSITDAYGSGIDSSIHYTYDASGNLLTTTDSAGNVVVMAYDAAGNKYYMNDPDLGIWNYRYNAAGKVMQQWSGSTGPDSSKNYTTTDYDLLGRVTETNTYDRQAYLANGNVQQSYNYQRFTYGDSSAAKGSRGKKIESYAESKLNGSDLRSQRQTITYDDKGRPVETNMHIGGRGDYISSTTYDRFSRPVTMSYPNGYQVTNTYEQGILKSVTGSDGKVHYTINDLNAFGDIAQATFGNGIKTSVGYDSVGFTGTIVSYSDVAVIANVQRLDYTYDKLGNVVTREDSSLENGPVIDNYTYDAMNRLSSQTTTSDVIGNYAKFKEYRYDKIGNIVYQTGIGEYTYHTNAPHAVKTAGNRNYTYDAVGNMINRNGDTITYSPLNKPAVMENHTNGKEVRFYYGIGDARYMKLTSETATYYIGKGYEEQVEDYEEKQIAYITVGNKVVGTHTEVKNLYYAPTHENYNEETYNRYFHTDALGSITAITDDTGTVVERRSYDAFGKIRAMDYCTNNNTFANRVIETTRAYTGHEQIAELSGLVHMNARVYDSNIGRFLSADTIIQAPHDSQSYNRYSYVRNNPLMYTDPSGHSWFSKLWKKVKKYIKTIAAIAIAAVIAVYAPGLLVQYGGAVFGSTVAGVTTLSAVGVMTVGAMAGFASGAIMTGSLEGALQGALWGAISAGVAFGVGHSSMFKAIYEAAGNMKEVVRALAHGLSRAAISAVRGGKAMGGFLSGFAGSLLGGFVKGLDYAKTTAGTIMKVTMTAIAGGTASVLGGGKFANGAMSAAFVFMFNHLQAEAEETKAEMEKSGRTDLRIAHGKGENGYYVTDSKGFKYMSDTPEMRQHLESLKTGLGIPLTIVEYSAGGVLPKLIMVPYDFYSGANFVSQPTSLSGVAGKIYGDYIRE